MCIHPHVRSCLAGVVGPFPSHGALCFGRVPQVDDVVPDGREQAGLASWRVVDFARVVDNSQVVVAQGGEHDSPNQKVIHYKKVGIEQI